LKEKLNKAGKTLEEAQKSPKSAEWKVEIANELRAHTTATNLWNADRLALGEPNRARNLTKETL